MHSVKPLQWAGILVGLCLAIYLVYSHSQDLGNVTVLGGVLLLEIVIASLWKYDERFFVLLLVAFAWAGMAVPLEGTWTIGRWAVLAAGTGAGVIIWLHAPRGRFGSIHLIAFFCICAAFVSASVSSFTQMAMLKALSLLLLFAYCATGARLSLLGREDRFFRGLLMGAEIAVYGTSICYFALGQGIWGNPNSLGAVMSVAFFPVLLWGWHTSEGGFAKFRGLIALLLCTYLIMFSMARAGMAAIAVVSLALFLCLSEYKVLLKVMALALVLVAVAGILAPQAASERFGGLKDAVLYKGHKDVGVMGSRRSPWEKTIANIKQNPWFGTGYGTSPTGVDPGLSYGRFSSSAETAREHGSSYMTVAEWVGLLGVLPFGALLVVMLINVWKVCAWMRRTSNPRHYSIPLAMVVLAGLVHAAFEDWLFAVGYYLCVFFWFCGFVLQDLVPDAARAPVGAVARASTPSPADFRAVLPTQ